MFCLMLELAIIQPKGSSSCIILLGWLLLSGSVYSSLQALYPESFSTHLFSVLMYVDGRRDSIIFQAILLLDWQSFNIRSFSLEGVSTWTFWDSYYSTLLAYQFIYGWNSSILLFHKPLSKASWSLTTKKLTHQIVQSDSYL